MKRIFLLFLAALMMLCLCACAAEPRETAPTEIVDSVCVHHWEEANCFYPRTCSLCKATEGVPTGHTFDNGKCIYCPMNDSNYNQLTGGSWIYIAGQQWQIISFYPDGTCEVLNCYGRPTAGTTLEECVQQTVAGLQMTNKDNWQELAERKYLVFKIDDYYYAGSMTHDAMEYSIEGTTVHLQQGTFRVMSLTLSKRKVLERMDTNDRYINMPYEYISNLYQLFQKIQ